jgi:hypothetical protein
MSVSLFDDVVALFGRVHADASDGRPRLIASLFRTALVAGSPVVDLADLAPAVNFDDSVIDDASLVRRHDLVRALEMVFTHLRSTPSAYSRTNGAVTYIFAARTDDDEALEANPAVPPGFRYTLIAIDGEAAAFVIAIGNPSGGLDAVLRCPAGPSVTGGLHPGVASLCGSIISGCVNANL